MEFYLHLQIKGVLSFGVLCYLRARCVLVNNGFVFVFYYRGYAVMIVSFVQLVQGQKGGSGCFPALFLPPLIF